MKELSMLYVIFKLDRIIHKHVQYLCAQCAFKRRLFCGSVAKGHAFQYKLQLYQPAPSVGCVDTSIET